MPSIDLDAVRALKSKATAERNRGRLDRAQQRLDEAIAMLRQMMDDKSLDTRSLEDVRGELADTFGMKGGVYRRAGDLRGALQTYRQGLELERQVGTSTYNLGNVIKLSIGVESASPDTAPLREQLASAIEVLDQQTGGARRDEWWAWADLAEFLLLAGQPERARRAHADGRRLAGPSNDDVQRHISLLRELAEQTQTSAPAVSKALQAAVQELTA